MFGNNVAIMMSRARVLKGTNYSLGAEEVKGDDRLVDL